MLAILFTTCIRSINYGRCSRPPPAIDTPTIDKVCQAASFYASNVGGFEQRKVSLHQEQCIGEYECDQPLLPTLESLVDATLTSSSFYSPATAAVPDRYSLEGYNDVSHGQDAFDCIASLAGAASDACS